MRNAVCLTLVFLLAPLILGAETVHLQASLSPSSEVPLVTDAQIVGEARVAIHVERDSAGAITSAVVDFDIDYSSGQAETLVNMHIHEGARGVSGPVRIDGAFGDSPIEVAANSSGRIIRHVTVPPDRFVHVSGVLANPAGYYVNIHSSSHPPGLFRGQLRPTDAAVTEAAGAKVDAVEDLLRRMAFLLGLRL